MSNFSEPSPSDLQGKDITQCILMLEPRQVLRELDDACLSPKLNYLASYFTHEKVNKSILVKNYNFVKNGKRILAYFEKIWVSENTSEQVLAKLKYTLKLQAFFFSPS